MSNATHETVPTEFVEVGGVRFAQGSGSIINISSIHGHETLPDNRGALQLDLRHQREGPPVYRTEGVPLLPDAASIVLNASIVGGKGFASNSVYSATKAAVRSFAHLDHRPEDPPNPRECGEPRFHRYSWLKRSARLLTGWGRAPEIDRW
jgi:hypothetical protein